MFQNSSGLHHIFEANHQNLGKGIDHGEEHPHLDQLDVGGAWEGLADSQETETFKFSKFFSSDFTKMAHNVARTSMTVRLTWMTMSRNSSVNLFTIWLKKINIAVGRFT